MDTLAGSLVPLGLILASAVSLPGQGVQRYPELVNAKIQASIDRGLTYLARTQRRDGSWRAEGYGTYPCAMTALAGMAILGSGSTPTRDRYAKNIRNAVRFLVKSAMADGLITVPAEERLSMHGHGFSTMFLAQVYGMEEDAKLQRRLHRVLSKAVRLIEKSQSAAGGWYYTPDSSSDEGSVTVTQVQALRACRNAGIVVSKRTIERAVSYIRRSTNKDGGVRYSLRGSSAGQAPLSAAAVAVLYNAGKYDDPIAAKCLGYAKRHLPINGSGNGHHFYSQLYLCQSLYQKGGKDWKTYFPRLTRWLMRTQQRDGSWQGDSVGKVYGTAIACTMMQLPYSLVPIYQR